MYYKSRYYDPYLARFLEADSVFNSNSLFGMNRYMYVEGNPVRFNDPSGHRPSTQHAAMMSAYFFSSQSDKSAIDQAGAVILAGWATKGQGKRKPFLNYSGSTGNRNTQTARKDMGNTFAWAVRSSGLKGIADTFNKVTGQDYEKRSRVTSKDDIGIMLALRYSPDPAFATYYGMYQGFKQLGARGGQISGGDELGLGIDLSDAKGLFKNSGFFEMLSGPAFGIFSYFVNFSMQQGRYTYDRNVRQRNQISNLQCAYVSQQYFKQEIRNSSARDEDFLVGKFTGSLSLYLSCSSGMEVN